MSAPKKQQCVAVIGDGLSGRAVVRSLIRRGKRVKLCALTQPQDPAWLDYCRQNDVATSWGPHDIRFFKEASEVVVSPGVDGSDPILQQIQATGIPCVAEILYARRLCRRPVIAVTGTCGKSTAATWIAQGLNQLGVQAVLCGNIGRPFTEAVENEPQADVFVVEVSSFQMETAGAFIPDMAVFTSFSQNHLDRHKTLERYFSLKARLFENLPLKGLAVLNPQHEWIRQLGRSLRCSVRYGEGQNSKRSPTQRQTVKNEDLVRCVLEWWGMTPSQWTWIRKGFQRLEHRLEMVDRVAGRWFINDSKATSPLATAWALSQMRRPVILLCGGRDKKVRFEEIGVELSQRARCLIAFGEAADKIKESLQDQIPVVLARNLAAAFEQAVAASQPGDVILLSPMCTSFDEFKDYQERGRFFKELIARFKAQRSSAQKKTQAAEKRAPE